ncbi:MAG TPA: 2'-5' RNA ligase family protein [Patescibacteria group bacterium]|nr:2'-5' RNA ligase family protein [Patescibacteria group bacterium]
MKYIIVSLLSGTVKNYHQKLVEEISERFDAVFLANQKAPTHFTLKDIFEADDISELDRILEEFARNHKPAGISLEGYNRFDDNVIYMDISFSEEARQLFTHFISRLKEIKWMQWGPYDNENRIFHCSLAYFDIKDKYRDICRFLLANHSYSFEAFFDNVAIYRQVGENWELYKSYPMTYDTL